MTPSLKLDPNPVSLFKAWYQEATQAMERPDAMVLATANLKAEPSARVVLLKGIDEKGLHFYTNYESRKSKDLLENPKAALVFFWPAIERQVRVEGQVEKVSASESDDYWNSRPRESCLSALSSDQSRPVPNRDFLENRLSELRKKYEGKPIPRPPHWGGFLLIPESFEFWMEGAFRLHDRFIYKKKTGGWEIHQLAP